MATPLLDRVVARNIRALLDVRAEFERRRSLDQRIAAAVTRFTGSMSFVYIHAAIFGGLNCLLMRTNDAGKTFSKVFRSETPNSLCWKVSFPSRRVGYVAVQDTTNDPATIAKTTDGGLTWSEIPLPVETDAKGGYPTIGLGFIDEQVGWIASSSAALPAYRTADGGETWEVDTSIEAPINRFRFVDRTTAYAIGGAV